MATAQSVLLVADDPGTREPMGMVLQRDGYSVVAINGAEAPAVVEHLLSGWGSAQVYQERGGLHAPIVVVPAPEDAHECAREIAAEGFFKTV